MKRFFHLLAVVSLLWASGCVFHEDHEEHHGFHDHDYGHQEHWDRDHER